MCLAEPLAKIIYGYLQATLGVQSLLMARLVCSRLYVSPLSGGRQDSEPLSSTRHVAACRSSVLLAKAGRWQVVASYQAIDLLPVGTTINVTAQAQPDVLASLLQGVHPGDGLASSMCMLRSAERLGACRATFQRATSLSCSLTCIYWPLHADAEGMPCHLVTC
jgi:hypothetical protein